MDGWINCFQQKRVVVSMINDFEVDVIETAQWVEMYFFVQIKNTNSTI